MSDASPLTSLHCAVGIELPGGQMRPFLESGTMFPTPQERVRLVSKLKERTKLELRILARIPGAALICVGSARLSNIRLNAQGEAQLLVSMQSTSSEFVQLEIQDELGKGEAVATFRLPSTGDAEATASPRPSGMTPDAVEKLLNRVSALETELEIRYEEEPRSGNNGSHGSGAEIHGPDEGVRDL